VRAIAVMSDYRLIAERRVQLAIKEKHQGNRSALLDLTAEWLELVEHDAKTATLVAKVEGLKRPIN